MLIALVDFEVAPENAELALDTLNDEAAIVRAMPGNLAYSVTVDAGIAGKMHLRHEWSDQASLAAYRESETFRSVGAALFPKMVGKPSTRILSATPLEA